MNKQSHRRSKSGRFVSIFLLVIVCSNLLPHKADALNQLLNSTFTGNANNWTLVRNDGLGAAGSSADANCATNSTTTTGYTNASSPEFGDYSGSNAYRFRMTNTSNGIAEHSYIFQSFTVPGTGIQLVRASSTVYVNQSNSFGGANTSWLRMDIMTQGHPYVWNGILGCKNYNANFATSTIGLDRTVSLTGGNTYIFMLTAKYLDSSTNPTGGILVDEIGLSTPPVNVASASQTGTTSPKLTWDVSTAASGAAGLNKYNIYRSTTSGGEGTTVYDSTTTNAYYDFKNAVQGTTYYYWITNVDTKGFESASSTEVSITAGTATAVPTVTSDSAHSFTPTTATLFGTISNTGGETGLGTDYGFVCSLDSTFTDGTEATTSLGTYSGTGAFNTDINGLSQDQSYYYRAYAKNSKGYGYGSTNSITTGDNTPARRMRLFEGYRIRVINSKMILYQQ